MSSLPPGQTVRIVQIAQPSYKSTVTQLSFSRERYIIVHTQASAQPGDALTVEVHDGMVVLSMDQHWSADPTQIIALHAALEEAQRLAMLWTVRDQRLAELLDRREQNALQWAPRILDLLSSFQGELMTPTALQSAQALVDVERDAILCAYRLHPPPWYPVMPPLRVSFDAAARGLTVEPDWNAIPSLSDSGF